MWFSQGLNLPKICLNYFFHQIIGILKTHCLSQSPRFLPFKATVLWQRQTNSLSAPRTRHCTEGCSKSGLIHPWQLVKRVAIFTVGLHCLRRSAGSLTAASPAQLGPLTRWSHWLGRHTGKSPFRSSMIYTCVSLPVCFCLCCSV